MHAVSVPLSVTVWRWQSVSFYAVNTYLHYSCVLLVTCKDVWWCPSLAICQGIQW